MINKTCKTCKYDNAQIVCNQCIPRLKCWMPIEVPKENKFSEILNPIADLIERKNTDYGNSYDQLRDKYGPVGFYIRISDKLNRIEQLDNNPAQVKDEAIEDTIRDIIGYATLELNYRKEKAYDKTTEKM
ncbi:conserved hypothetical protein [Candidatus Desulfosporosinus infrequens]|uniref:Nucleotide modification associated domain-containing protein n=1 Tax=Candidatus Desulfosporosinus infrequens TaxID=2043169 RepID=A0A2U3LGV2_9FIRM|nr:conserved hypothetical protein [Candidatus Desulfosporosinus infrequens]